MLDGGFSVSASFCLLNQFSSPDFAEPIGMSAILASVRPPVRVRLSVGGRKEEGKRGGFQRPTYVLQQLEVLPKCSA